MQVYKSQAHYRRHVIATLKEHGITLEWKRYSTQHLAALAEEADTGEEYTAEFKASI